MDGCSLTIPELTIDSATPLAYNRPEPTRPARTGDTEKGARPWGTTTAAASPPPTTAPMPRATPCNAAQHRATPVQFVPAMLARAALLFMFHVSCFPPPPGPFPTRKGPGKDPVWTGFFVTFLPRSLRNPSAVNPFRTTTSRAKSLSLRANLAQRATPPNHSCPFVPFVATAKRTHRAQRLPTARNARPHPRLPSVSLRVLCGGAKYETNPPRSAIRRRSRVSIRWGDA